jgi:hypothetical protein
MKLAHWSTIVVNKWAAVNLLMTEASHSWLRDWKPIAIQLDFGGGMFFSPVPEGSSKNWHVTLQNWTCSYKTHLTERLSQWSDNCSLYFSHHTEVCKTYHQSIGQVHHQETWKHLTNLTYLSIHREPNKHQTVTTKETIKRLTSSHETRLMNM